jgi:CubicO group peptidase (beta-lactamase class C family)
MVSTSISLHRSSPELQGLPSSALQNFLDAAQRSGLELHSLMLLRHGQVVAEGWWHPYSTQNPHLLYSLSKSFCATAAGLAIQEGLFSLDDTVISFFPDESPSDPGENLAAMRVRHLLSMSTGHIEDTTRFLSHGPNGNWAAAFLAQPVEREPGTHFLYNSGATYMVAAILQKVTGQTLLEFLEPRLFALGITGATWDSSPQGVNVGGWGMSVKTEDIAKFGQLYLQKGVWNGERILSEAWVAAATSKQVSNGDDSQSDWQQGYGFQFWCCRHNAYRGDGAFGQYCVVMPDQDAVLAITSNVGDMGAVLNHVWEHLLPACSPSPLPENEAATSQLRERLSQGRIAAPQGEKVSPLAAEVSGQTYNFVPNDQGIQSISFDFKQECILTIQDAKGTHQLVCGLGEWHSENTTFLQSRVWAGQLPKPSWRLTANGAWTAPDTFQIKLCFDETPFTPTLICQFLPENHLLLDLKGPVGFGDSDRPQLEGKAA